MGNITHRKKAKKVRTFYGTHYGLVRVTEDGDLLSFKASPTCGVSKEELRVDYAANLRGMSTWAVIPTPKVGDTYILPASRGYTGVITKVTRKWITYAANGVEESLPLWSYMVAILNGLVQKAGVKKGHELPEAGAVYASHAHREFTVTAVDWEYGRIECLYTAQISDGPGGSRTESVPIVEWDSFLHVGLYYHVPATSEGERDSD